MMSLWQRFFLLHRHFFQCLLKWLFLLLRPMRVLHDRTGWGTLCTIDSVHWFLGQQHPVRLCCAYMNFLISHNQRIIKIPNGFNAKLVNDMLAWCVWWYLCIGACKQRGIEFEAVVSAWLYPLVKIHGSVLWLARHECPVPRAWFFWETNHRCTWPCARRTRMFVDSWGNGFYCHDCVVPCVGHAACLGMDSICGAGQKMCIMMLDRKKTDDIDRQVCQDWLWPRPFWWFHAQLNHDDGWLFTQHSTVWHDAWQGINGVTQWWCQGGALLWWPLCAWPDPVLCHMFCFLAKDLFASPWPVPILHCLY